MPIHHPYRVASLALAPALALLSLSSCKEEDKFAAADKNSDGVICAEELGEHLLGSIFADADADGDEKVSFEEWQAINPDAEKEQFLKLDADGDGVIAFPEAATHFKGEGIGASLFGQIDANGDGGITREEAAAYLESVEAEAKAQTEAKTDESN